jgi:hypothetical protein
MRNKNLRASRIADWIEKYCADDIGRPVKLTASERQQLGDSPVSLSCCIATGRRAGVRPKFQPKFRYASVAQVRGFVVTICRQCRAPFRGRGRHWPISIICRSRRSASANVSLG